MQSMCIQYDCRELREKIYSMWQDICESEETSEQHSLQALFEGSVNFFHSFGLRLSWAAAAAGLVPGQMGLPGLWDGLLLHCWVPHERVTPENTHKQMWMNLKKPVKNMWWSFSPQNQKKEIRYYIFLKVNETTIKENPSRLPNLLCC